ncbi:PIN-like domain-containing protein [Salinibacter ruber]|uniref:PIN-like domain-containing protein n=1 Tax=Salinibacter ruber TaxID=146919 RepID=UPI0021687957|nr:PIN-like domain-containing protein [Salinibacter ruber]MCS3698094.1 hypothetical protein [Salinibacter ruber]
MREQFPWFLDPTEEELQRLWEEATFSFDANVLLNLYRVDRETTEDYFKIFRELGDRIFLPHEAAKQFFHNRRGVIRTEQNSFSEAKKRVQDWVERRSGFDNLKSQLTGGDIGQIIGEEIENVFDERERYEGVVETVKDDLIDRIEDLENRFTPTGTTRANAEEDEILGKLMEIFDGKTGDELDDDIDELKKEAKQRYEKEKPPGYEDYDGEDELSRGECEDFLIWKQLMNFAERGGEDTVFVSGEKKPDWWEKNDDYELVRPRHELFREFKSQTGQTFWMLTIEEMVRGAERRLEIDVKDKSTEQTIKVSESEEISAQKEALDEIESLVEMLREMRRCIIDLPDAVDMGKWQISKSLLSEFHQKYNIILENKFSEILIQEDMAEIAYSLDMIKEGLKYDEKDTVIKYSEKALNATENTLNVVFNKRNEVSHMLDE